MRETNAGPATSTPRSRDTPARPRLPAFFPQNLRPGSAASGSDPSLACALDETNRARLPSSRCYYLHCAHNTDTIFPLLQRVRLQFKARAGAVTSFIVLRSAARLDRLRGLGAPPQRCAYR